MTRYAEFTQRYPSYETTLDLDELRQREYSRLDRLGHIYLDYTGGGLYAESQLRAHHELLRNQVFGNPHSTNPTSLAATALVEATRESILRYFNASPDEYVCVFTQNASGALKLVGESYPFSPQSHYLLTFDNHNSVNGIREYARSKGAQVHYIPVALPDMRLPDALLEEALQQRIPEANNLFAYPAQSNFSSVQHSLEWIEKAHRLGWDVLLDAAAFTPTNCLDLSRWKPDFVPLSFYKMFGYPTGIGALLMRRQAAKKLRRPWFAGGTITVASVQGDRYYLAEPPASFEDGTLDYLNIPAVEIGLRHLEAVGIEKIHERVRCLTGWLLDNLIEMKHKNGQPLVKIYGPLDTQARGGAIALNFFDPEGRPIDIRKIEQETAARKISLRTGCFCNPGAGEIALQLSRLELVACFSNPSHTQRLTYDDFRTCIDGKASGAVRISVGMVSNFADVEAMLEFARSLLQ